MKKIIYVSFFGAVLLAMVACKSEENEKEHASVANTTWVAQAGRASVTVAFGADGSMTVTDPGGVHNMTYEQHNEKIISSSGSEYLLNDDDTEMTSTLSHLGQPSMTLIFKKQ